MRSARTRAAIALCAVAIVAIVVLAGSYVFFGSAHSTPDGTYVESPSSIHASVGAPIANSQMRLQVNKVADASTGEMRSAWEYASSEGKGRLYNHPLVPPEGERYIVANITVTNIAQRTVPFAYTDMYLVGRDGSTYYSSYVAAADRPNTPQLIRDHTLSAGDTHTLYVLFPVPSQAQVSKLVYESHPPIVVSLT